MNEVHVFGLVYTLISVYVWVNVGWAGEVSSRSVPRSSLADTLCEYTSNFSFLIETKIEQLHATSVDNMLHVYIRHRKGRGGTRCVKDDGRLFLAFKKKMYITRVGAQICPPSIRFTSARIRRWRLLDDSM